MKCKMCPDDKMRVSGFPKSRKGLVVPPNLIKVFESSYPFASGYCYVNEGTWVSRLIDEVKYRWFWFKFNRKLKKIWDNL